MFDTCGSECHVILLSSNMSSKQDPPRPTDTALSTTYSAGRQIRCSRPSSWSRFTVFTLLHLSPFSEVRPKSRVPFVAIMEMDITAPDPQTEQAPRAFPFTHTLGRSQFRKFSQSFEQSPERSREKGKKGTYAIQHLKPALGAARAFNSFTGWRPASLTPRTKRIVSGRYREAYGFAPMPHLSGGEWS
jgi:hypothetical protein